MMEFPQLTKILRSWPNKNLITSSWGMDTCIFIEWDGSVYSVGIDYDVNEQVNGVFLKTSMSRTLTRLLGGDK